MTATLTDRNDARQAQHRPQPEPPRPTRTRRRRILFGISGLVAASLLLGLATVMKSNADFSGTYVTRQLSQEKITFKPVDGLTPQERESACVVANAGKQLTTGKQAECFANEYIGLHIKNIGQGKTYAELGDREFALQAQVTAAQAAGDPALAGLQKELAGLRGQRDTLFKAEMLRGTLLTSFGFSTLGEKAGQASTAAYAGAALVALLSVVGLAWAVTSRTR
jgi:hypothetical protein